MTASDYYKKFPARGPVSEMAVRLVSRVSDESVEGLEGADLLTIPKVLDAELQEVRDVLRALKDPDTNCWCLTFKATRPHATYCQRAHALMLRLQAK